MTDHFKLRAKRYATVLTRWMLIAALVFIATMTSGIYITNHLLAKVYSATATVQVHPRAASPEAYSGWAFSSPQSRAVEAELESVESPEVLRAVISGLGLDKTWAERVFNRSDALTSEESLQYLESNLHLNFKHDANIVEVTALSDDPKEAAEIANQVVDMYKLSRDAKAATSTDVSTVRVVTHADVPFEPTKPDKRYCYAIAAGLGGLLSVMIASSLEICLLIARAEAAADELRPMR